MSTTFQSFDTFVAKRYHALSDGMQAFFGNCQTYMGYYLSGFGFSEWLETLRDSELEEYQVECVARTFARYGRRTPEEMPSVLASIARQYNVELPAVEGILSATFWQALADRDNWPQLVYQAAA
ncbi:hypothetical protein [Marinobacter subterrani]|uniref:hypothetical protein n=1 Tax=Marinobacter subterrani TaxID=1658765 RepID=UPI0023534D48|nr:hypothetical protein [Marinobacter subterrani]